MSVEQQTLVESEFVPAEGTGSVLKFCAAWAFMCKAGRSVGHHFRALCYEKRNHFVITCLE